MATAASATTAAENIAEDITEHVAEVGVTAPSLTVDARMSILIVPGALFFVRQHFEGLVGLLKNIFCVWIIGIAIGVVLHSNAAIRFLKRRRVCTPVYSQYFVVVTF